jgi:hypothetical protein
MASGGNISDLLICLEMMHRAAVWNISRAERLRYLASYGLFDLQLLVDIRQARDEVAHSHGRALAVFNQQVARRAAMAGSQASSSVPALASGPQAEAGHAGSDAHPSSSQQAGSSASQPAPSRSAAPGAGPQLSPSYDQVPDPLDLLSSPYDEDEKQWWDWRPSHRPDQQRGSSSKGQLARERRCAGIAAAGLQRRRAAAAGQGASKQQELQPPPVVGNPPAAWRSLSPEAFDQSPVVPAFADLVHDAFLSTLPAGVSLEEEEEEDEEEKEPSAEDAQSAAALVAAQQSQGTSASGHAEASTSSAPGSTRAQSSSTKAGKARKAPSAAKGQAVGQVSRESVLAHSRAAETRTEGQA